MSFGSISRRGGMLALALMSVASWSACSKPDQTGSRATPQDAAIPGPSPKAAPARPAAAKPAAKKADQHGSAPVAAELAPIAARGTLLQRLPKTTLVAMRFPHVEKLKEAWLRTPLHSLLDLPQLAEQRDQMNAGIDQMTREMSKQLPDFEKLKSKVLGLEGEVVLAVISVDANAIMRKSSDHEDWPFTLAVMMDAGSHADEVDSLFQRFFELVEQKEKERESGGKPFELVTQTAGKWHRRQRPDGGCIDLTREGSQFVLQVGPSALAQLDGMPLAQRALDDSFCAVDLVRATPDLGKHGSLPIAETFVNLAPVWTAASVLAPAEVKNVLDGSGATSIAGISITAGLGKAGIDEALLIYSPGGKDLLTQVLTNRPLNPKVARFLAPDSAMASLTAFDLAALVDGVVKLLPTAEKKEFEQALANMRGEGFDLRGDVIGNIGPTFGFAGNFDPYKLMASQFGQVGGASSLRTALDFTLLIELQDAPRFKKLVEKLLRTSGAAAHVRPEVVQGVPTSRLEAVPIPGPDGQVIAQIEPSWHIGDDVLVFSTSGESLEKALAASRDAANRGPAGIKSALEQNGGSAWAISATTRAEGGPAATSLGRRTAFGLELTSFEGPGATTAYVLGAGVGVVASVAIPQLLSARAEANEKVAIATLRTIASAETMFQVSAVVDQDHDGRGEYGTLGELTGTVAPAGSKKPIEPPVLSNSMAPDARGCFTKAGFVFRIDVPRRAIGGADAAEQRFMAYAWPLSSGSSGIKVYVIDAEGRIFFSDNRGDQQHYEGQDRAPGTDASELRDEGDRVSGVTAVRRGRDGGIWLEYE